MKKIHTLNEEWKMEMHRDPCEADVHHLLLIKCYILKN